MEELKMFVEEGYALLTTAGISVGSLLLYMISWLRTKVKNIDRNTFYKELEAAKAEVEVKLQKEYQAKFEEFQQTVINGLTSLENKVMGKIDDNEAERKAALKKQTMELEATINAVNNKASIDDILGE